MARTSKKPIEKAVVEDVKKCSVIVQKLNVREEASTDSEVLTIVSMGDVLEITQETPRFYGIKTSNFIEGFVVKDFVSVM